jgi:hypothetical protein
MDYNQQFGVQFVQFKRQRVLGSLLLRKWSYPQVSNFFGVGFDAIHQRSGGLGSRYNGCG